LTVIDGFPLSPPSRRAAIALGSFDGVHRGHAEVVGAAAASGLLPGVVTFTTYRSARILSESLKLAALESLGAALCIRLDFESIRDLAPEKFLEYLTERLDIGLLCCGENFRFGAHAAGDAALLRRWAVARGIGTTVLPLTLFRGEPVSSTAIRGYLDGGEPERAAALLGRPYAVDFPVAHGREFGRAIGIPTANQVYPDGFCLPRFGVYASRVHAGGRAWPAVTNVGVKPTVGAARPLSETHLLDFSGDLYGQSVKTELLHFLRPERKFESLEALQAAMRRDMDGARAAFAGMEA